MAMLLFYDEHRYSVFETDDDDENDYSWESLHFVGPSVGFEVGSLVGKGVGAEAGRTAGGIRCTVPVVGKEEGPDVGTSVGATYIHVGTAAANDIFKMRRLRIANDSILIFCHCLPTMSSSNQA